MKSSGGAPTMKDVARVAGVSVMTVSRALRDEASVKKETREHIRKAADKIGYVLDEVASNLRTKRTNFVAVIIPSVNSANFADTLAGLGSEIESSGRQLLLGISDYDVVREEKLIAQLLQRRPEAIVVTGGRHTDRARKYLKSSGIPVVETWDLPEEPIEHVVGFSNAATMVALVDHLVTRGRRHIAFIGGDASRDTRGADRLRGFRQAMEAHGMQADRLIPIGAPPASMIKGAAAMRQLLKDMPDTDAVVGVSDLVAFGALTECQRRGVRVPEDIAIAGFGAYEIAAVSVPLLTTIDVQPREIGRRAGELVVSILDGEGPTTPRITKVETWLTLGGTAP